jgi:hypothetical protein
MQVEIKSYFFTILLDKKSLLIFSLDFVLLCNGVSDFMEIFFIELFELGPEYFFQYFIDFDVMSQLDHSISLINDEIFQMLKVKDSIFEEFVYSTWSTDNNMGPSLPYDSQLSVLGHTTDNGND